MSPKERPQKRAKFTGRPKTGGRPQAATDSAASPAAADTAPPAPGLGDLRPDAERAVLEAIAAALTAQVRRSPLFHAELFGS